MCITVLKARHFRNTYHSYSVIVNYLRFRQSHGKITITNTLQCIDYPSRNKLEEDKAADFCEV